MRRATIAAAAASPAQIRRAYSRAIAQGAANTHCTAREERAHGALRLLTLATLRLPDLALCAHRAHVFDDELAERADQESPGASLVVLRAVSDSVGALRLAHRALESHGHELDYAVSAWVTQAIDHAGERLDAAPAEHEFVVGVTLELARLATSALTRATAATAEDPMLVPDPIADALGPLLAVYLIVSEAGAS